MTLARPLRASTLSNLFVFVVVAILAIAPAAAACGNGVVEPGEDCDDGSAQNGGANSCCTTSCTFSGETPDVIVGDLTTPSKYGTVGSGAAAITAYSVGTISCNLGSCWLNWISTTAEHPVIGQNMFRLMNGRIEQIGQSWLKHGFTALTHSDCATCVPPPSGSHLGVNCSDPYVASLNGDQTNLGPKNDVNPNTGVYLYPDSRIANTSGINATIGKRLQVHNDDLAFGGTTPTARYFLEGQYVTHDDASAKNNANNASYKEVLVSASPFNLTLSGGIQRQRAGIQAWKDIDPTVTEVNVSAPEGLFILSAHATALGGGVYHYEYAVQNLTNQRAGQSFSVPIPPGAIITNAGFHDVDYHTSVAAELYDGTDWPATIGATSVSWATTPYATNPNANALRWGTLYNFRFDANVPPGLGVVTIGLFRPGSPSSATASTVTPGTCVGAPDGTACNDGNPCTLTDACSGGACVGGNPVVCSPSDQCHAAGTCDSGTGACSNPTKANGSTCNDGSLCTQSDSCQNGACLGSNPIVCTASDQCHDVGVCAPVTGVCSNPNKPNGAACVDADLCTVGDTCQAGSCQSGGPLVCTPINACHVAGVCNPGTGACSNPSAPDGSVCNDGNACTQTDLCSSGICQGTNPILCAPTDACHQAGTCAPGTGICSNPTAPNGTPCSDGNVCIENEGCLSGLCQGGNPITCVASDSCHLAGTCTPGTGCSNPAKPDGSGCNDANSCTDNDTCASGVCAGTGAPSPGEIDNVVLSENGPVTTISWNMALGATSSGVLRGSVSALPVGPGDGDEVCLDASIPGTSATDSQVPDPGEAYWYLIQGINSCGKGPYGSAIIDSLPVTRSSTTCP